MGNHDAEKISAGIRKMDQIIRRSTPDSKALGQVKSRPLKAPGMNCPASTKFWIGYVKYMVPPGSLQTIPTEIVGSSSSPADLTLNTRGSIHQAKVTNPKSSTPENRRLSH